MEIIDIKSSLSITDVLSNYGLKVDKNNRLCCPFHEDKTPSMQVYPETNTVYCFSSNCKLHGKAIDQIDFIMFMESRSSKSGHKEDCSKHEAIVKAKAMIGSTLPLKSMIQLSKHIEENLSDLFAQMQRSLHRSPKGLVYLQERHLDASKLEVGFNSYNSGYKQLQNCVVFPLKDKEGGIVSLYGRTVSAKAKNKHFYLKNRQGLYPGYPKPETKLVVLCEAIVDAATLMNNTDYSVLSLFGANGWNEEHTAAIKSLEQLEEICFFFDGDEAGKKAVETYSALAKTLTRSQVTISKVDIPAGEDINSLAQNHPDEEANILAHMIAERNIIFLPASETGEQAGSPDPSESDLIPSKHNVNALDTTNSDYLTYTKPPLMLSVLGGVSLLNLDRLKVTLGISRTDSNSPLHRIRQSNLDLYSDDQLDRYIRKASERLEVGSRELRLAVAELITELEDYRQGQLHQHQEQREKPQPLNEARQRELRRFLEATELMANTDALIEQSGVVGEKINRQILWYVYGTRLQAQPLHVICLGASGTGKTWLQEHITDLIPDDQKVNGTAMTDNALYYAQDIKLEHKLFVIEDLDGATNVLYSLRELQTKASISKLVTNKDAKGNLKTIRVEVKGPICLTATTTKERLYEDNANRCLLIYLDGSAAQREAIMAHQRKRSAGNINRQTQREAKAFLQDIQRMLRPVRVVNPYAEALALPASCFKPLRTNQHYLLFIEAITFYHQYQREHKTTNAAGELVEPYIMTTIADIEAANELIHEVLLAKSDELTRACRLFLERLQIWLTKQEKESFYATELRQALRLNPKTLSRYLMDLQRYGYIKVIGGNKYHKGYEYELASQHNYEALSGQVRQVLDEALAQIKSSKEKSTSVPQQYLSTVGEAH